MKRPGLTFAALLVSQVAGATDTCPSDNAKVTPEPAELARLCPKEKVFQEKAVAEGTGLQCIYNFALISIGSGPKVPQAWIKVSSDPGKRASAREVAEADAKEMSKRGLNSVAEKVAWKGVDAYVINSSTKGMKVPGDLYYVKTSKGIRTVQLKSMNKVPTCIEQVIRDIAAR